MNVLTPRLRFAKAYASRHLALSFVVALLSAALVFGLFYPPPFRAMLGVGAIFLLVLAVDVVCGPLLTFVLADPKKSRRERWIDFSLVGLIQMLALAYGLHSVWTARPVAIVFAVDQLVVVTANEIDAADLPNAPPRMRRLPAFGVVKAGTRRATNSDERMDSLERELAGQPPATRPSWWIPWHRQLDEVRLSAKPLTELIARRPRDAQVLRDAANKAGADPSVLVYLPLTNAKVKDWVALLDADLNIKAYAQVDGF